MGLPRLSLCGALLFLAVGCADTGAAMEEAEEPTPVSGPAIAVEARLTDGVYVLSEDPLPVSGCHSGGDSAGRTIAYAEQTFDLRQRAFGFTHYDLELAEELDLPASPGELDIDVAAVFEVDPDGFVSSADDASLGSTTGFVSAGWFGVFYRQTLEVRRPANIVALTERGDEVVVGELILTDWDFRADIGTGESCPPFPPAPSSMTGE